MDKTTAIHMACRDYEYKWPKELWTGIMFYSGVRITIEEFNQVARMFV